MKTEEKIKLLDAQLNKLAKLQDNEDHEAYEAWHKHTELLLKQIFGDRADEVTELSSLHGKSAVVVAHRPDINSRRDTEVYFRHAKAAESLLKGIVEFLKSTVANGGEASEPVSPGTLEALHEAVKSKCSKLYQDGSYPEAVEKGFKVVRDRLRNLTTYETGSEAFGKGTLYIKGATAPNVDNDFQQAVKFLTMAIDQFRNEKSHTSDSKIDDPVRAYEYLALSSLAMHLLDNVEVRTKPAQQPAKPLQSPKQPSVRATQDAIVQLDDLQVLCMRVLGSMSSPKELAVLRTLGGGVIEAFGSGPDNAPMAELHQADIYEVEANLDQLAGLGILTKRSMGHGGSIYGLAKSGYDLLKQHPELVKTDKPARIS